jgi:transcriptional regulator with XRE-family HTH domain
VHIVGELMRLIQEHLDKYGVSRAEFARRAGTLPQTVQNWISRHGTLPQPGHLRGVADVLGLPYETVLNAALMDSGYLPDDPEAAATLHRLGRHADVEINDGNNGREQRGRP